MAKYRTAQGKVIDMSQLAAKNEKTRAVGNMSVNARGDTIDGQGKVVLPVTKKVGDKYQKTVSNRAASLIRRKTPTDSFTPIETAPAPETKIDLAELVEEELEFLDTTEEDEVIDRIKAIEAAKALEANLVQASKKLKIKPASEAPDSFDPTKD